MLATRTKKTKIKCILIVFAILSLSVENKDDSIAVSNVIGKIENIKF